MPVGWALPTAYSPTAPMLIVDAHLDLAYNAVRGRDVTLPADQQLGDDEGTPSVGLPDLQRGGVGLICGTVFCQPATPHRPDGYHSADEAHAVALRQLAWYRQQQSASAMQIVMSRADLPQSKIENPKSKVIVLLEGADPIRTPADLQVFHDAGLRIIGMAWQATRFAGGTHAPGPLTSEAQWLIREMDARRMIHDVSHLAEQSFWQLLDLTRGPVMASHSNCRAIIPTDRQLSDVMIRAIVARGGVIGINFYDKFLIPPSEYGTRRATLADVVRQIRHIADLVGNTQHIGIGTDMDGGLGREKIPAEISTSADLPRVADCAARCWLSR